jgi:ketosteroid isomerase-like protein
MFNSFKILMACSILVTAGAAFAGEPDLIQLRQQVEDTERAFAQTMADRDHAAFKSFLSVEAVFFAGEAPLIGEQQVADAWEPFFQGPDAPFSWEPQTVVVLESGALALSSGPVRDPEGKQVATFNSIWRLGPGGEWKIVFDKGSSACNCPETEPGVSSSADD